MKIRNLTIVENDVHNKDQVIKGITELDLVVMNNYEALSTEETIMEFNIGSQVGESKKYFVVYNNPVRENNPYYFILELDKNGQKISNSTTLDVFQDLEDYNARRYFHAKIVRGFKALPKHRFLGEGQIQTARDMSREFDENR